MEKFQTLHSAAIPLPLENIDTDQIIPARFLKATTREGFCENVFRDWRCNADGTPKPNFVLNNPRYAGQILLAGKNFGCGSSREHAAWALYDAGFRVVISSYFADIFRGNALKNGVLPVIVPADVHAELMKWGGLPVKIDLASQTVTLPGGHTVEFPIDPFAKECMLNGIDELGYMLSQEEAIAAYEAKRVDSVNTLA